MYQLKIVCGRIYGPPTHFLASGVYRTLARPYNGFFFYKCRLFQSAHAFSGFRVYSREGSIRTSLSTQSIISPTQRPRDKILTCAGEKCFLSYILVNRSAQLSFHSAWKYSLKDTRLLRQPSLQNIFKSLLISSNVVRVIIPYLRNFYIQIEP